MVAPRHPPWVRKRLAGKTLQEGQLKVGDILRACGVRTVCSDAHCPNLPECFQQGCATFLVMGPRCSRHCRFCGVPSGSPLPLDPSEPERIAQATELLGLEYVVITSVTRDDLEDGGSEHFARTIETVRKRIPSSKVEALIPDFQGNRNALQRVLQAGPAVLNHNVETVPRLYAQIRPEADFQRSLDILRWSKEMDPTRVTKSGLMVGLGEEDGEVEEVLAALARVACDVVTLGQYLAPSSNHASVMRYPEPASFDAYREIALSHGIPVAFSGCFVRSSWGAATGYRRLMANRRSSESRSASEEVIGAG